MTVATTTNKAIGTGNGVSTTFPFTFGTLATGDLVVSLFDLFGTEIPQVENTDYTVLGEGSDDGGAVVFAVAPPSGYTVQILRIVPLTQPTDLKNQGSYYPRTVERMSDRSCMIDQQFQEQLDRAIKIPSRVIGVDTDLPPPAPSAILGWNDAGTGMRNYPLTDLATAIAYGSKSFQVFTGDGVTQDFTLSINPVSVGNLDVAIDGLTQVNGTDFTLSGTNLHFASAPPSASVILIRYDTALPIGSADSASTLFIQSGASAVARSAQDKMRDEVSVFDFMTDAQKGDVRARTRTIDCTAAFNAAYATGKRILAPAGDYLIGGKVGTLGVNTGLNIEGDGDGKTVFVINGTGSAGASAGLQSSGVGTHFKNIKFVAINASPLRAINIDNSGVYSYGDIIEGCSFISTSTTYNFQSCIEMANNWNWSISQCSFQNGVNGTDYSGNCIALHACVAGVIDSCNAISANRFLFMATDVINSHMCEGLTITNCNIANVDACVFAPDNTISSTAHHYSLTISHSTIDPIRSFGIAGYINSLRLIGNHFGITSNAGVLCTLLAGSYSTVIAGNRVVGGSYPTSTATAIVLNTQGASITGNCMEGFNIIADLSNAPSSVVVGNVFTNTTSYPVILTGANSTYSGNQEVNCAVPPNLGNNAVSGSYTPTLSNSSGVTGTPTATVCNWYRVRGPQGDRVHVFGSLTIQPTTAGGITNIQLSLPIASAYTANADLAGTAVMEGTSICCASIRGVVSTHNAWLQFIASADVASRPWYFEFSYVVK